MKTQHSRWSGQMSDPYELRRSQPISSPSSPGAVAQLDSTSRLGVAAPPLFVLACTACRKRFSCTGADTAGDGASGIDALSCSRALFSGDPDDDTVNGANLEEMLAAEERRKNRSRLLHRYLQLEERACQRRRQGQAPPPGTQMDTAALFSDEESTLPHLLVSSVRSSAGKYGPLRPSPFSRWHPKNPDDDLRESLPLLSEGHSDESVRSSECARVVVQEEERLAAGSSYPHSTLDIVSRMPVAFTTPFDWLSRQQEVHFIADGYRRLFRHVDEDHSPYCPQPPLRMHEQSAISLYRASVQAEGRDCFNPLSVLLRAPSSDGSSHTSPLSPPEDNARDDSSTPRSASTVHVATVSALHQALLGHTVHASMQASGAAEKEALAPFHVFAPLCPSCWAKKTLPRMQKSVTHSLNDREALSAYVPPVLASLASGSHRREVENKRPLDLADLARSEEVFSHEDVCPFLPSVLSGASERLLRGAGGLLPQIEAIASAEAQKVQEELDMVRSQQVMVTKDMKHAKDALCTLDAQVREGNRTWASLLRQESIHSFDEDRRLCDEEASRLAATAAMNSSISVLSAKPIAHWAFPLSLCAKALRATSSSGEDELMGSIGFGSIAGLRLGLVVFRKERRRIEPPAMTRPTPVPASEMSAADVDSLAWHTLQNCLRRQRLYTQVLLSGEPAAKESQATQRQEGELAFSVEEKVSVAEVNAACGLLATLLVHLADVNRHIFRCARFHLSGEHTTIDVLERPALERRYSSHHGNSSDGGGAGTVASLFNATSFLGFARPTSTASAGGASAVVAVKSTVDFFLNDKFFSWKTFGTACDMVLECVDELCDALRNNLQCQRRRLQFVVAETQQHEKVDGDGDATTSLAAALSQVPAKAPFSIAGNKIDGFPFTHGTVTDAVWTVAAARVAANVQWCVEATSALLALQQQ